MKFAYVFISALILHLGAVSVESAKASNPPTDVPELSFMTDKPIFEDLADRFKTGSDVRFEDIKGHFYSGRCFMADEPNKPKSGLLAYVSIDKGPAYGEQLQAFANYFSAKKGLPEDFFDKARPAVIKEVRTDLRQCMKSMKCGIDLTLSPSLSVKEDIEGNGRPDYISSLRRSGDYLVLEWKVLIAQTIDHPVLKKPTKFTSGDVFSYCYYFKELPVNEDPGSGDGEGEGSGSGPRWACYYTDKWRREYVGYHVDQAQANYIAYNKCVKVNNPFILDCKRRGCRYQP